MRMSPNEASPCTFRSLDAPLVSGSCAQEGLNSGWMALWVGKKMGIGRASLESKTFIERHSWHVQTNPAIQQQEHVVQMCIFVTKSRLVTK